METTADPDVPDIPAVADGVDVLEVTDPNDGGGDSQERGASSTRSPTTTYDVPQPDPALPVPLRSSLQSTAGARRSTSEANVAARPRSCAARPKRRLTRCRRRHCWAQWRAGTLPLAKQADRFQLYEQAVQSCANEVRYLEKFHRETEPIPKYAARNTPAFTTGSPALMVLVPACLLLRPG